MNQTPALFLDRDGIILETKYERGQLRSARNLGEARVISGVPEALSRLSQRFRLFVVTNQPDVSRGKTRELDQRRIHQRLRALLPIADVAMCPHDNEHKCECRKPAPGLLHRLAREHSIDCSQSWMIGDRHSDVEAGRRAGCKTIWIDYGYPEKRAVAPDYIADSAPAALELVAQLVEKV